VAIQGKLYHRIGPLDVQDGATPQYAQLYVHDAAEEVRANKRYAGMDMPASTPTVKKERLKQLLRALESELRGTNTYVMDFLTAAEVFANEDVVDGQFVLDAKQRPADAQQGQYDGASGRRYRFSEVCVLLNVFIDFLSLPGLQLWLCRPAPHSWISRRGDARAHHAAHVTCMMRARSAPLVADQATPHLQRIEMGVCAGT